jgi:hypothetical protein
VASHFGLPRPVTTVSTVYASPSPHGGVGRVTRLILPSVYVLPLSLK